MTDPLVTNDEQQRLPDLLAWGERLAQTGSWDFVPSQDQLVWSDNHYRIFGVEPGAVRPSVEFILAQTHADDREQLAAALVQLTATGGPLAIEYRITRADGDRRHLRSTTAVVEQRDSKPYRIIGVIEDLTDRRRAEREIAAHVAVEEALVVWDGVASGAHRLLAALADALECVGGVFWVPRGDVLVPRVVWHESGVDSRFEAATRARPLRRASGLAGRVWEARKPMSWTLGATPTAPPQPPPTDRSAAGLTGAIALPALVGDEVLAIVELDADREIRVSERLMRSLIGISHELGHFLARRGGELAGPLLTPREVEMLQLAADGLSAPETAKRLTVSPATVKTHLENIYRKLEVCDKPSAVATSLRLGLID